MLGLEHADCQLCFGRTGLALLRLRLEVLPSRYLGLATAVGSSFPEVENSMVRLVAAA